MSETVERLLAVAAIVALVLVAGGVALWRTGLQAPDAAPVQVAAAPAARDALVRGDFAAVEAAPGPSADRPIDGLVRAAARIGEGREAAGLQALAAAAGSSGPDARLAAYLHAAARGAPPPHPWDDVLAEASDPWLAHWLRAAVSRTAPAADRLALYDAAIAIDPGAVAGWLGKIGLLQDEGRRDEALEVFAAAAEAAPDTALFRRRAAFHVAAGELDAAARALAVVNRRETDDHASRALAIQVLELAGQAGAAVHLRGRMLGIPPSERAAWLEAIPAHRLALGLAPAMAQDAAARCADAALARDDGAGAVRCLYQSLLVVEHTGSAPEPMLALADRIAAEVSGADAAAATLLATWVRAMGDGGGSAEVRARLADTEPSGVGDWVHARRLQQLGWAAAADPVAAELAARIVEPPPERCDDAWALVVALDRSGRDITSAAATVLHRTGPCGHLGWDRARRNDVAARLAAQAR